MGSFWQLTSAARSSAIQPSNGELGQRLHHSSTKFSTDSSTIWRSLARWSCLSYYCMRCRCLFGRGGLAQGSLKSGEVRVGRRRTPPIWNGGRSKDRTRRAWFPDIPRCGSPDTGKHPFFTVTFGQTAEKPWDALQNRMVTGRTNAPEECFGTRASVHARESGKATLVTTSNGSTTQESEHDAHALKSMWQRAREPMIVTVQTSPCEDRIVSCTRRSKQRTRSLRAA
jgi:hypothetical protein